VWALLNNTGVGGRGGGSAQQAPTTPTTSFPPAPPRPRLPVTPAAGHHARSLPGRRRRLLGGGVGVGALLSGFARLPTYNPVLAVYSPLTIAEL